MTLDQLLLQYATPLAAVAGLFVTVNLALIRWLSSKFQHFHNIAEETRKEAFAELQKHEDKDQDRFEQILNRFEKVAVALAKLGSDNGKA